MSRNGSWKGMGEFMAFDRAECEVGGRLIASSEPVFVIAEIGLNHGGSLDRALALVDAAAAAGASAIKLQTLEATALVAPNAPAPSHVTATSMREFFARFELDEAAHRAIISRAREHRLAVLATPLSEAAVDLLDGLGVDGFKIASGDVTWAELIVRCARTRRPLVISTGMSALSEVRRALGWAQAAGAAQVALLHCVSAYPVPAGSENLRAIATLAEEFGVPVGLSDHSADTAGLPLAIALGASIYERHLILERGDGSIDADVSSTPAELAAAVRTAAQVQAALGSGHKACVPAEMPNKAGSRRGLYAARRLPAGHVLAPGDLVALRPATGVPVERQGAVIGCRLAHDVEAGLPLFDLDLAASSREASRVA